MTATTLRRTATAGRTTVGHLVPAPAAAPTQKANRPFPAPPSSVPGAMTSARSGRVPVPDSAMILLDRSSAGLLQACAAHRAGERYVSAHLAALRSAAAMLAVRGRGSRGGPRSVWELLPRVAPELAEWAAFFAATASRRAAIEAGRAHPVSAREADDLLRAAEAFQHAVEEALGLTQYPVLPEAIPACANDLPGDMPGHYA